MIDELAHPGPKLGEIGESLLRCLERTVAEDRNLQVAFEKLRFELAAASPAQVSANMPVGRA